MPTSPCKVLCWLVVVGGGGQVQLTDWTGAVAGLAPLESPVHTDIQTRLEALLSLIDNYEYVLVIKVIVNDA